MKTKKFKELVITRHVPKVGGILTGAINYKGEFVDFSGLDNLTIVEVVKEYTGYTVTCVQRAYGNHPEVFRVIVSNESADADD